MRFSLRLNELQFFLFLLAINVAVGLHQGRGLRDALTLVVAYVAILLVFEAFRIGASLWRFVRARSAPATSKAD